VTELPYLRMRRRLNELVGVPVWAAGVHLKTLRESHAADVHALLELVYADGGGSVSSFEEWWPSLSQDGEYDLNLCFSVCDEKGGLVGFAQCWTSAFVKEFVVHPSIRRCGIGRALLLHIFGIFQEEGP